MSRIENDIVDIKRRLHILEERTKNTEMRFNVIDPRMNYMQNGIENIIKRLDGVTMTKHTDATIESKLLAIDAATHEPGFQSIVVGAIHVALSALPGRLVSLARRSSFTNRCASARSAIHWRAYI
jgi:hypothetical protein